MSRLFFVQRCWLFHYLCVLDVALTVIATCCRHDQHQNEVKQQARKTGGEDRQCCVNHTNQGGVNFKILGIRCELWLRTIRDFVAHMIFCHALALRSARTLLAYVPR